MWNLFSITLTLRLTCSDFFFPQPVSFPSKLPSVGSLSYQASEWRKANLWLGFLNHNHPSGLLLEKGRGFCRLSDKHLRKCVLRSPKSIVGPRYRGQEELRGRSPGAPAWRAASTRRWHHWNIKTWLQVSVFWGEHVLIKDLLCSSVEGQEEDTVSLSC